MIQHEMLAQLLLKMVGALATIHSDLTAGKKLMDECTTTPLFNAMKFLHENMEEGKFESMSTDDKLYLAILLMKL